MAASAKSSQLYAKELGPDCIACLCRQYLSAAPGDAPWELRSAYMRQVLSAISEGSRELTAPEIGHKLDGLLREQFGVEEDRTEEKLRLNELVMGWEDDLWRKVVAAKDPVALAARLAACGNYVDFSVQESVEEDVLARFLERAGADEGQGDPFSALSEALLEARSAVLLADNCGEAVLDKMLLRAVKRSNPVCEATVIVRDGRVSGDVTLADAAQVGLGEVARVVSNGNDVREASLVRGSPGAGRGGRRGLEGTRQLRDASWPAGGQREDLLPFHGQVRALRARVWCEPG